MLSVLFRRPKLAAIVASFALMLCSALFAKDWIRGTSSPENLVGSRRLVVLEDSKSQGSYDRVAETLPIFEGMDVQNTWRSLLRSSSKPDGVRGDFDGDGVDDHVDVEYYHREPLFSRSTSGMVKVVSGGTGECLLACAVDCPMNQALWCGDVDSNGTDDLLVVENGAAVLFGFDHARTPR